MRYIFADSKTLKLYEFRTNMFIERECGKKQRESPANFLEFNELNE